MATVTCDPVINSYQNQRVLLHVREERQLGSCSHCRRHSPCLRACPKGDYSTARSLAVYYETDKFFNQSGYGHSDVNSRLPYVRRFQITPRGPHLAVRQQLHKADGHRRASRGAFAGDGPSIRRASYRHGEVAIELGSQGNAPLAEERTCGGALRDCMLLVRRVSTCGGQ